VTGVHRALEPPARFELARVPYYKYGAIGRYATEAGLLLGAGRQTRTANHHALSQLRPMRHCRVDVPTFPRPFSGLVSKVAFRKEQVYRFPIPAEPVSCSLGQAAYRDLSTRFQSCEHLQELRHVGGGEPAAPRWRLRSRTGLPAPDLPAGPPTIWGVTAPRVAFS
jgi:hypothetical protein